MAVAVGPQMYCGGVRRRSKKHFAGDERNSDDAVNEVMVVCSVLCRDVVPQAVAYHVVRGTLVLPSYSGVFLRGDVAMSIRGGILTLARGWRE